MFATGVHFIGGAWGHLSVGLFADASTGPKGLFLGGGYFQLIVQAISVVSVSIWSAAATLAILSFVDHMIPIRLDPEDEIQGCDITEHHSFETSGTEVQKSMSTFDRVFTVSTPIARRFSGPTGFIKSHELDDYGRRKVFFVN